MQTLFIFCHGGLLYDWSHMDGFYNNFIWGQMATRKAVDHQTHRPYGVTSVIKLYHFPSDNPRGRGGRNEEGKERKKPQKPERALSKFMKEESEVLLTFMFDEEKACRQDELLHKQTLL